jgi:hypothetical protein
MNNGSRLSFEEYAAWCASRLPPVNHSAGDSGTYPTICAFTPEDECPVTVRSAGGRHIITPVPGGSQ